MQIDQMQSKWWQINDNDKEVKHYYLSLFNHNINQVKYYSKLYFNWNLFSFIVSFTFDRRSKWIHCASC